MVFPASHFHFIARRIRIYPFDGKGVKRCSCNRIFLAIEVVGEAVIGGSPVRQLSRPCDLCSTPGSCLPHIFLTLYWVPSWGLGFGGFVLPGSRRTGRPKLPDGCDRYADNQVCCDVSHSS